MVSHLRTTVITPTAVCTNCHWTGPWSSALPAGVTATETAELIRTRHVKRWVCPRCNTPSLESATRTNRTTNL